MGQHGHNLRTYPSHLPERLRPSEQFLLSHGSGLKE